jgi:HSP20 family protein
MALIPWTGRTMPVTTLTSLRQEMNDLVGRFWTTATEPFGLGDWSPPVDVSETSDAVIVHVEIPGIDVKDLDISVAGDTLTIRGEKKEEERETGRQFHRVERRYGTFTRTLPLPAAVDADHVEAKSRAGVLEIRLPKREEAKARRVTIRTE